MAHLLVEFRLQGFARRYAKWANARIHHKARQLGLRRVKQRRFVSHITLFGPAETHSLRPVMAEIRRIGQEYTLVPFTIGVFDAFQNPDAHWLYLDVEPSPQLEKLRYDIAQSLLGSVRAIRNSCRSHDHELRYKFHSAVIKCDPKDRAKFEKLYEYAQTQCSPQQFRRHESTALGRLVSVIRKYVFRVKEEESRIHLNLLRITVLGEGGRIQAEYDLILKKMLSRREALSRHWWRRTIGKLKELQSASPAQDLTPMSGRPVYFIGDAHFDHRNIIKYCGRGFSDVTEMNQTMMNNWNSTVGDDETVYYLGDWAFGYGHKPPMPWKNQLKGTIVSIRGSHDRDQSGMRYYDFRELRVGKYDFLLIHDPDPCGKHQTQEQAHKLENWHGWIIHGHVHNNELDRYPFINGDNKTINVSAEVVGYRPVSLSHLLSLNLDSIKRMRTIESAPERW